MTQAALLLSNAKEWNEWRASDSTIVPDLSDLSFADLDLSGVDFSGAILCRARFDRCNLTGARLDRAYIDGTSFANSNLQGARLNNVRLQTAHRRLKDRLQAKNIVLAFHTSEFLNALNLPANHNDRLAQKDLRGYQCPEHDFEGAELEGFDLRESNLMDCNFANANLQHAKLNGCCASWSNFSGAQMQHCDLKEATLEYCNLQRADLRYAKLRKANLSLCDFDECNLKGSDCRDILVKWRGIECDIKQAHSYVLAYYSAPLLKCLQLPETHNDNVDSRCLSKYLLNDLNLDDVDLERWNLSGAVCVKTTFRRSNLRHTNFTQADLSEANLDRCFLSGSQLGGAKLGRASFEKADLSDCCLAEASLEGATLEKAILRSADLTKSNLSGANLRSADFNNAQLAYSDASRSDIRGANFESASLEQAKLEGADFREAKFYKTRLVGANFSYASVIGVSFVACNIQGADFQTTIGVTGATHVDSYNERLAFHSQSHLSFLLLRLDNNDRLSRRDFAGEDFTSNSRLKNLRDADFSKSDLSGATLSGAELANACFSESSMTKCVVSKANLQGATFDHADLSDSVMQECDLSRSHAAETSFANVDLRRSVLTGAFLQKANFLNATLRDCTLEGCDLRDVICLYTDQLAGTNLNGATLPTDIGGFRALENVKEITISAKSIVMAMLVLCVYCSLQMAATKDGDLLTDRGALSIPVLALAVPVTYFYLVCPAILICVYIWCHFYIQHLWEELAKLPAIFQDSRKQYLRVYPWFLNAFVAVHFPLLRSDRPLLVHIQIMASVLLTWWLVPITIALFWLRYLPCRRVSETLFQSFLLVIAVSSALFLQELAGSTLRGETRRPMPWPIFSINALRKVVLRTLFALQWPLLNNSDLRGECNSKFLKRCAIVGGMALVLALISVTSLGQFCRYRSSVASISNVPESDWSASLESAADIHGQDLSVKLPSWTGDEKANRTQVVGAHLEDRDLRHMYGFKAFLASTDLSNSQLQGANLRNADLRWAILQRANLRDADLSWSDLRGAELIGADLTGAQIEGARFDSKSLKGALGLTDKQRKAAVIR